MAFRRSLIAILIAGGFLLLFGSSYVLAFNVSEVNGKFEGERLEISFDSDIELSEDVEKALLAKFPIDIVTKVKLYRERDRLWDDFLKQAENVDTLVYRSLYRDFIVHSADTSLRGPFATLATALVAIGRNRSFSMDLSDVDFQKGGKYVGVLEVFLSKENLPTFLKVNSLFDPSWSLSTSKISFEIQ